MEVIDVNHTVARELVAQFSRGQGVDYIISHGIDFNYVYATFTANLGGKLDIRRDTHKHEIDGSQVFYHLAELKNYLKDTLVSSPTEREVEVRLINWFKMMRVLRPVRNHLNDVLLIIMAIVSNYIFYKYFTVDIWKLSSWAS
jgi:hypothetical protein